MTRRFAAGHIALRHQRERVQAADEVLSLPMHLYSERVVQALIVTALAETVAACASGRRRCCAGR